VTDQNSTSDWPAEVLPEVPPPAAARLRGLLDGRARGMAVDVFRSRLTEWLALANDACLLIPPEFIVPLLDHRDEAIMFADLTVVVGERGRWLARGNELWKSRLRLPPVGDPAAEFWRGSTNNRIGALKILRASDPGRARELLAAAWDSLDERSRFAAMFWGFRPGLGADDEPFLESVLAKEANPHVMRQAEELLWLLPDSAFAKRARARAWAIVRISRSHGGVAVSVTGSPSATELREIVSWTQPVDWPADVLQAVSRTKWAADIIAAIAEWTLRIRRFGSTPPGFGELTRALIDLYDLRAQFPARPSLDDAHSLLGCLPRDEAEHLVMEQLRDRPAVGLHLGGSIGNAWTPWSVQRSAVHLHALAGLPRVEAVSRYGTWLGLRPFAHRGDPAMLEEAETVLTGLAEEEPAIAEEVDWALDELRIRRLMRDEIAGRAQA
jgi:hypothetical protein